MQIRQSLLAKLRRLKSLERHLNGGQQQLLVALDGKRGLWSVKCCPKCLEEVSRSEAVHACGEAVIEVQLREPKKVPGGYVSAWN